MKGRVLDDVALMMAEDDTVATVLEDVEAGHRLEGTDPPVVVAESVPFGHKIALDPHEPGEEVRKYGEVIGEATATIDCGQWVHTHNCESTRGRGDRAGAEEGTQ